MTKSRRPRRRFVWTCNTCGASGQYDPKTGVGVVHRPHCALAS